MPRGQGDRTKKQQEKPARKHVSRNDGKPDGDGKSEPKTKLNKAGKKLDTGADGRSKAKGGKPPKAKNKKDKAPEGKEREKQKELTAFARNQKEWCEPDHNQDPSGMAIQQGERLLGCGLDNDPNTESFIAVVGDQSAGKSVVVMSLLKLIILDVRQDIGTCVRTYVKSRCELKQREKFICSLKYPDNDVDNLSVGKVMERYIQISERLRKQKDSEAGGVDTENICEITVSTKTPMMGFGVIDHAGFAPNVWRGVQKSFNATLDGYFKGSNYHKNACVLLCHRINKPASEDFFSRCYEQYAHLRDGQLYVAFTQCDRIEQTKKDIMQQIKEKGKHMDPQDKSKVRCKAMDILNHFIQEMMAVHPENKDFSVLPEHTQFFFVAGYRGDMAQLMEMREDARLAKFLDDPIDGQKKVESLFAEALEDANSWKDVGLILEKESAEEREQRKAMMGMEALSLALRKRSFDCYKTTSDSLVKQTRQEITVLQERKQVLENRAKGNGPRNIPFVLGSFVDLFLTMNVDGLASPVDSKGDPQTSLQEEAFHSFRRMRESDTKPGWTLADEHDCMKKLEIPCSFPPEEEKYQHDDYVQLREKLLSDIVPHRKEYLLCNLVRRFQLELALLSCLMKIPDVDVQALSGADRSSATQQVSSMSDALMQQIQDRYRRVWRGKKTPKREGGGAIEEGGGMHFAATRVALACLLHAQNILNLMREMKSSDQVASILEGQSDKKCDLVGMARYCSRVHPARAQAATEEPVGSRFKKDGFAEDLFRELIISVKDPQASPKTVTPYHDACKIIIAHFFDKPYEQLKNKMEYLVRKIELCSTAYTPMSIHFGPLFMHQDHDFLTTYKERNPKDHYPNRFIQSPTERGQSPTPFHTERENPAQLRPMPKKEPGSGSAPVSGHYSPAASPRGPKGRDSPLEKCQEYSGNEKDKELFNGLSEKAVYQMQKINAFGELDPLDKARLLCSLIRANKLPDVVGTFEAKDPGEDDRKSLHYVSQRFLTCAQKRTLDDVLEACAALQHDYLHSSSRNTHHKEITERLESLLLGYGYPYLYKDRPAHLSYFSEAEVIPFLACHKASIQKICQNFHAESDGERAEVSEWEHKFSESPLVQAVIVKGKTDENAVSIIDNLHGDWQNAKRDGNRTALVRRILDLVAPRHYQAIESKDKPETLQQVIKDKFDVISACKSYNKFLQDHGAELLSQTVPYGTKPRWVEENLQALIDDDESDDGGVGQDERSDELDEDEDKAKSDGTDAS